MKILNVEKIIAFENAHPETEGWFETWRADVSKLHWRIPPDVKQYRPKTSIVKNSRAVFDILNGRFRMVVRINYERELVQIRFIGTHKEYDHIDSETI